MSSVIKISHYSFVSFNASMDKKLNINTMKLLEENIEETF